MINCVAVEYHRHNLFHGDVKPDNIFFSDEYDNEIFFVTSDVGSVLHLGEADE
jgi:serine/threonine protein kinase